MRASAAALCAAVLIVVSGCGKAPPSQGQNAREVRQSLENAQQISQLTELTAENKKLTARLHDLETSIEALREKHNTAERRLQAISLIVRLLVYTLVVTALLFAWAFHDKMLMLKNRLYAKPYGRWVVVGAFCIYLIYDIHANASLITDWLLQRT